MYAATSVVVAGNWPVFGTRPGDGFRPKTPLNSAGIRIDPADVGAEADRGAAGADRRALAAR